MKVKGDQSISVTITMGTIAKAVFFLLFLAFLYIVRDLVLILITAVVLASAIEPGTRWFMRYKVPRAIGVLVIYVTIIVGLSAFFYFFIPSLLDEIAGALATAPEYLKALQLGDVVEGIPGLSVNGANNASDLAGALTSGDIITGFQSLGGISGSALGFVSGIFGGLLSFILIIVVSFYLAVRQDGVAEFLKIVTPFKYESYVIDLWKRTRKKIGLWLQGQLLLMLIVGVLVYLGLTIFGVPNALLLAVIAGLLEIIPIFGPIISAIPAIAIGIAHGGISLGLIVAALFAVVQQFENHLIYPLVVKKVVGMPSIIVIIAIIIGGQLAGFLGMLLSVPIATAVMEVAEDIEKRKRARHKELEAKGKTA